MCCLHTFFGKYCQAWNALKFSICLYIYIYLYAFCIALDPWWELKPMEAKHYSNQQKQRGIQEVKEASSKSSKSTKWFPTTQPWAMCIKNPTAQVHQSSLTNFYLNLETTNQLRGSQQLLYPITRTARSFDAEVSGVICLDPPGKNNSKNMLFPMFCGDWSFWFWLCAG